jgi:uncharacterized membrane protein
METLAPFLPVLVVVTTVGAAIMAGLLFAFSSFVMRALAQLPPASGMDAMQRINLLIVNPLFLLVFVGTAIGAIALLLGAAPFRGTGQRLVLCGALCYLLGVIGVTAAFNIPLNNVLAATPASAASDAWPRYVAAWLPWNHLRTAFAVAAVAFLVSGALKLSAPAPH